MIHLDEGRLQAFLDGELTPRQRASVAEHMLRCEPCRARLDDLKDARAVFSAAVAVLDRGAASPALAPPPRTDRSRIAGRSFARAAAMVLFAAAALSAAVPGSPIREWIGQTVAADPVAESEVAVAPIDAPETRAAPPAGISVRPGPGVFDVALSAMDGVTIRLLRTTGSTVSVKAVGSKVDPRFGIEAGRIEASGGRGGEIVVEFPRTLAAGRLVVDGRVYAETVAGELMIRVAGAPTETDILWR